MSAEGTALVFAGGRSDEAEEDGRGDVSLVVEPAANGWRFFSRNQGTTKALIINKGHKVFIPWLRLAVGVPIHS